MTNEFEQFAKRLDSEGYASEAQKLRSITQFGEPRVRPKSMDVGEFSESNDQEGIERYQVYSHPEFEASAIKLEVSGYTNEAKILRSITQFGSPRIKPGQRVDFIPTRQKSSEPEVEDAQIYVHPEFGYKFKNRLLSRGKLKIILSRKQARIFEIFVNNPNMIMSYEDLEAKSDGLITYEEVSRYYISRIRRAFRKIGIPNEVLQTLHGKGFVLRDSNLEMEIKDNDLLGESRLKTDNDTSFSTIECLTELFEGRPQLIDL